MSTKFLLLILLNCFLLISNIHAENWPHWRGPEHNGISRENNLPTEWSKTQNILWRLSLSGPAAATPVVWEKHIFFTSTRGKELFLACANTKGRMLWKRSLGYGNKVVFSGEGNSASPSPSTDGKHVWAFVSTGILVCYDFKGNKVWATNLQKRYGNFNLYFVMSSTPLLDKSRLYIQLIHSDAQLVLALNKSTGKEIWRHKRKSDARSECKHSYASPVIYRDNSHEYLLVHGSDYITAHNLKNGSEKWRCGGFHHQRRYNNSLRLVASPVTTRGLIVVPSAKNGPVLGIRPGGTGNITNTKQLLWKIKNGTPDVPSPLIYDGLLYLCRENGSFICMNAFTGKKIYKSWAHRHLHRASPVYADGKIYVPARNGVVTVVQAGRTFKIIAKNKIHETVTASLAIANGTIYLRSHKALYAIKKK